MPRGRLPIALRLVAALHILSGIWCVVDILLSLFTDGVAKINLGVLGVFIGIGLLRLRPGWRICALVFVWIGFIAVSLFAVFALANVERFSVTLLGERIGRAHPVLVFALAVIAFAICLWEYRVLTRPDIRRLFDVQD